MHFHLTKFHFRRLIAIDSDVYWFPNQSKTVLSSPSLGSRPTAAGAIAGAVRVRAVCVLHAREGRALFFHNPSSPTNFPLTAANRRAV